MVINRANSGVSKDDMERTVGMPALAEIRSAGMLFVRASNEGRTVVERFPNDKVIGDLEILADQLIATRDSSRTKSGMGYMGVFSGGTNTNPSLRVS